MLRPQQPVDTVLPLAITIHMHDQKKTKQKSTVKGEWEGDFFKKSTHSKGFF